MSEPDWAKRFWSKVNKNGPVHPVLKTKCWLWTACLSNGYGFFNIDGKLVKAHRVSFFLAKGRWPVPFGLHKCDIRACVNDDHLFEGTQKDNLCDASAKGRTAKGDRNGARLHPERVARGGKSGPSKHPESMQRGDGHWSRRNPEKVCRGKAHWTQTKEGRERLARIRMESSDKFSAAAKRQWANPELRERMVSGMTKKATP